MIKSKIIGLWASKLVVAIILIQTLFYKFSAHPDSILIFSQLGVEPYGRIFLGVIELIIAILIIVPNTTKVGALGGIVIMFGAIISHIFVLGINFNNDNGILFSMSIIVFTVSVVILFLLNKK